MQPASYHLENTWSPDGGPNGRLTFTLVKSVRCAAHGFPPRLYLVDTRHRSQGFCDNAVFLRRNANFLRIRPACRLQGV